MKRKKGSHLKKILISLIIVFILFTVIKSVLFKNNNIINN